MKQFHIIEDFLDMEDNSFALSGTSPLDGETYNIASSADVLGEISGNFGERCVYVAGDPMDAFADMWGRWLRRRGNQIAAAWQALNTEYNPLENYNRTETHDGTEDLTHGEVVTHGGTDNRAITPAGDTVTTTPGITTTVTITPAETTKEISPAEVTTTITPAGTTTETTPAEVTKTTENSKITGADASRTAESSIYAFNSNSAVKVSEGKETDSSKSEEKTTQQNPETVTVTVDDAGSEAITMQTAGSEVNTTQTAGSEVTGYTGHDTVQTTHTAGSDNRTVNLSDTHSGKDSTKTDMEIHAYGNIGVMSSQQMLEMEIKARQEDFIYRCILEFINLYTVYA